MRYVFGVLLLMLAGLGLGITYGWVTIPAEWNPFAPLDVKQPPNLLTSYKLRRLQHDPTLCSKALETSPLRYVPLSGTTGSKQCPLDNVVRVQRSEAAFSGSFLATCSLATAYAMFELHALQPAAQAVFGQRVTQVEHFGSFACRNIYGRANARRSEHATANALDLAGFRLADGSRITVARDWKGDDDKARFLRLAREGACKTFNTTLSPDYNAAHRDHFHVDMGGFHVCR
ncbi:hypothetical protein IQ22_00481 [Pseudomonas duriflava]|uniref:Extensin-like C-terminal domain-containing protein n=1 Tax=Pseudomonas duriflava TaxID=459528 RepID=A0A562QPU4_9PSED|nr:extensin family protein [Pseudomonas duriflava]TWI58769.1 hypothetical protein IQ22_00481 [Pseudomonas duriflava]